MRTRWPGAALVMVAAGMTACASSGVASSSATEAMTSVEPPAAASAAASAPTSPASSGGVAILPAAAGAPPALEPGAYATPDRFQPPMTVTVPDGWFGAAGSTGFGVGRGLDTVAERFADAELYVDVLAADYADAVALFQALPGLSEEKTEPIETTVGGHPATTFRAQATGGPVLLNVIAPGLDIGPDAYEQTFVDVDGTTLLIRSFLHDSAAADELREVLGSITIED